MIQGLVAKKIIDSIVKKVMDNRELKKIKNLEKRVKKLEKFSHEPKDFICMSCGCSAKVKQK
tara:strand:+ start:1295 stop:1480 length:186 start_codon:yes stop_codon:yes gene_type:complete